MGTGELLVERQHAEERHLSWVLNVEAPVRIVLPSIQIVDTVLIRYKNISE